MEIVCRCLVWGDEGVSTEFRRVILCGQDAQDDYIVCSREKSEGDVWVRSVWFFLSMIKNHLRWCNFVPDSYQPRIRTVPAHILYYARFKASHGDPADVSTLTIMRSGLKDRDHTGMLLV